MKHLSLIIYHLSFCTKCAIILLCVACSDNDSFTTSRGNLLTFSVDTVKMDTVFSNVGSSTYTFWVFNHSGDGIRLNSVRLRSGNQTGFRANVDGTYLDNSLGSVVNDLEVRKDDSIRVFVELTAPENRQLEPQPVEDDLVFALESGVEQRVHLQSCAWDAVKLTNLVVTNDTTIESRVPIILYGDGIRVDSGAVLTVRNTTLYFHDRAGISVYGTLLTDSVVMRGDRLDHMFDYLPYDRVSGQWQGLHFYPSSTGNELTLTEIRNAVDAVVCDSAAYDENQFRLILDRCIVHNSSGAGVLTHNANIGLYNCLVSNTMGDCVAVYGGRAELVYCTLAQFYPLSADRGAALRFTNSRDGENCPLHALLCVNSLVTGYADDVVMGESVDSLVAFDYYFEHCLLRTPKVDDTVSFSHIVWEEKVKQQGTPDSIFAAKQHFVNIDEKNLYYDFHLDSLSAARGQATNKYSSLFPTDLNGVLRRKDSPDLGCYESEYGD